MKKQRKIQKQAERKTSKRPRHNSIIHELWRNRALYIMCLPALAWLVVFCYVPMYGAQIAFRKYNARDGITKSPFVGLKNFEFFFKSNDAVRVTGNTLLLNFLCITLTLVLSVSTAILLNEVRKKKLKKIYQTMIFFPYFVSWVVVQAILQALLSDSYGLINSVLEEAGLERIAWYSLGFPWVWIVVICSVWKSLGYNTVIYLARITSIDQSYYEAARIDGASKMQEIIRITLPLMKPTIIIMLLMSIGGVFRADLNMFVAISPTTGASLRYINVIDTYVYGAMRNSMQYGMSAAVGLWQSVMGFALVMFSNWLVRRYESENALF
ncbi:MAG: sugar ABC transporter permease [Roseburia sp.]|nr:sugar ABC transporter permease [Roseburia sp.]